MKKLKYILLIVVGLMFWTNVYANEHQKIVMDIYVDSLGTAHVTQEWAGHFTEKTENYHQYFNLGDATIDNFSVSMNGQAFTTLNYWDINASFDSKAYKAGINQTSEGVELCYGISKYGTNTYVMKYDINGFVASASDADIIYWTLLPGGISLGEYYIKIYSDFEYEDTLPVWGYGNYGGIARVTDGYIEFSNSDGLNSDEYVVALVKFPQGSFSTYNTLTESFDEMYEKAEEGANHYEESSSSAGDVFIGLFTVLTWVIVFVGIAVVAGSKYRGKYGTKKLVFKNGVGKLDKNVPYFRDIPCEQNIFKAYWVACNYSLIKQNTDFLGALLLKWLKEERIQNLKVLSRFFKKETNALKFLNGEGLSNAEAEMYNYMESASVDGILEQDEFKKWSSKNYNKLFKWFNRAIDEATDTYVNEGLITAEDRKAFLVTTKHYIVNSNIKDEATRMKGLKSFLEDFSMIHSRESIEVHHWDYYLIYAQIFGIAKKVSEEFKKLYPEFITESYYNDMIFIHTFSNTAMRAARSAQSAADNYSSGGGGFSSGGGGGGSFGGGGSSMGSR